MQIYRLLHLMSLGFAAALLAACASKPPPALPTPTALPRAVVLPITTLVAEPQRWSGQEITLVAPVSLQGEEQVLSRPESVSGSTTPEQAIWLEQPLPDSIRSQISDTNILKIRGRISPPGAYGREQQFPYQISAEEIEVLQPERTTLANLTQNPHALDRILLSVEGTLLAQQNAALLNDQVSEGGVPTGLHQIKLQNITLDSALLEQLNSSGEVRWGKVQVTGWWQDGTLTPFKMMLAEQD